jgi:hypothetical protein
MLTTRLCYLLKYEAAVEEESSKKSDVFAYIRLTGMKYWMRKRTEYFVYCWEKSVRNATDVGKRIA